MDNDYFSGAPTYTVEAASPRMTVDRPVAASNHGSRMSAVFVHLRGRSQTALYSLCGLIGSLMGAFLGGAVLVILGPMFRGDEIGGMSESLFHSLVSGLAFATWAAVLGTTMFLTINWFHRRKVRGSTTAAIVLGSAVVGALVGCVFQLLFDAITESSDRISSIAIFGGSLFVGAFLGTVLTQVVPNIDPVRGTVAGLLAGLLASLCGGLLSGVGTPVLLSSILALSLLGALLGVAIAIVERRFRRAMLEIEWDSGETTLIGLGPTPVTVGGGKDHIYIPGAPARVSSIGFSNDGIEHVETANGKRTPLQDGSRLRIGDLTMVLHVGRPSRSGSQARGGN